ncbi:HPr family phosphocarrier protein [Actinoplanes sp. NEAU-A12]|uniref:Phosphocarrier protein HPr n=1 Tax=Actinoplanes sandaracinus TaxID=3045177 RepID=A0ABT6WMK5_9ACTN|nr:HPr family phosphocarrier protein [Actinoplanes sandaracinus]MDI6100974.1 HPr family phosphocarrier protein [Actinoplanes sandaracinus]
MSPSSDVTEIAVVLPAALHARPAGEVVRAAAAFASTIEVRLDGRSANARSALRLMSLGAAAGSTVTVHASGDDAPAAAEAVAGVLAAAK